MAPASRLSRLLFASFILTLTAQSARADEPAIAHSLQPFVDDHELAGAVTLVASPDKILSLQAVGYADVDAKTPMKTDNLFWIASMSKPVTATALMMLVDEGKVKLDDPVDKYLPEFHDQWVAVYQDTDHQLLKLPKQPSTVRSLLSHTSGMPFKSALEEPTLDLLPLRVGVLSYAITPLRYEPGTKHEYSNAGINTAGRIIEVVSGMPYEEFLDKRLFEPLGMKDTTFWPNDAQVERLAKSYQPNSDRTGLKETKIGQLKYPLTDRTRQPMPGGGLFSTAADMGRFCQVILNGGTFEGKRYVSEASVREMTSTQTGKLIDKERGEGGYGLGWSTSRKSPGPNGPVIPGTCGHGGAHSTNMSINPELRLITVYMVQHAGFPHDQGGKILSTFTHSAFEAFGKK